MRIVEAARAFIGALGGSESPRQGSAEYARRLLAQSWEAFRLARRDRPRENNQPKAYSGDSAITGSDDLMHRRTRDLVRNTAEARTIQRAFVNLVVGRGMQTFCWPFLPSETFELFAELEQMAEAGELGPRLRYALESDDLYEQYFHDAEQFDIEGRLTGPEMFRMLMGESVVVGNGLMVKVFRPDFDPDKHLVPLAWQMVERDQLDTSKDRDAGPGTNKIIGGIEVNSLNQTVAYHLYTDHPDEYFGSSGASVTIAANRVIDLALYDRPSSTVGHSWLGAAGQSVWDKDSFMESEMRSAAVDSVFAVVAKLENAHTHAGFGFADGNDDTDSDGNQILKVGHSPVAAVIGPTEDLEMVKPTRPNRDCPPFIKLIQHDIASASGLSYYTLTGDYASTNFSSSRAAKLDEDSSLDPIKQWFGARVALPVRRDFNAIATAGGLFSSLRPAEFRRQQRTFQRFDCIGAARDLLDPFKEGEARTARLRTKISTFKDECAKRGEHWIAVLRQQAIENRMFKLFGIEPDFTKAGTGGGQGEPGDQAEEIADRVGLLLDQ